MLFIHPMNGKQIKPCEEVVPQVVKDLREAQALIEKSWKSIGNLSKKTPNRLKRVDRLIKIINMLSSVTASIQFDTEVFVDRR